MSGLNLCFSSTEKANKIPTKLMSWVLKCELRTYRFILEINETKACKRGNILQFIFINHNNQGDNHILLWVPMFLQKGNGIAGEGNDPCAGVHMSRYLALVPAEPGLSQVLQ